MNHDPPQGAVASWEYLVTRSDYPESNLSKVLDQLGPQGWELVSFHEARSLADFASYNGWLLIFKRARS